MFVENFIKTILNEIMYIKNSIKAINIEIKNIKSFYNIEYDISKILYYNNIKYETVKKNNKIILKIYLNEFYYYFYDKFNLNDLYKIIKLDVNDSEEYLLEINKKLSDIKY